ncbi:MAG: hypothetical protein COU51_00135 [Parcubacteria group bacterium CG10_big_fil_rev_8_21_14_0_10_36_14]|nr:MAG: hypothetical protein COU51_00135 [Parcubacteria group bacterium CG10_big_fil_rev_8_21_14_0_10_36_14]
MKIRICILSLALCFLALPVLAQEVTTTSEDALPDAGWTPEHPLYFLEQLVENLDIWFSFQADVRAEKVLKYADEKLAELKLLAETKQTRTEERSQQLIEKALGIQDKYQKRIELEIAKAEKTGIDISALRAKITEGFLRHGEVLTKVFSQVPENAKEAIGKVIDSSNVKYQVQLQKFDEPQKKALEDKLEQRVRVMEDLQLQQQNKGEDDKIQVQQRVNQQEKVGNTNDAETTDDTEITDDTETTDSFGNSGTKGSDSAQNGNGQSQKK